MNFSIGSTELAIKYKFLIAENKAAKCNTEQRKARSTIRGTVEYAWQELLLRRLLE